MSKSFQDWLTPIIPELSRNFGTPFHIYDEVGIRKTARALKGAFAWADFQEYFAVKALPNPAILQIMFEEGFGFDCSSIPELILARQAGARGEDIMFTSNNTSQAEFLRAQEAGGCILNLDDITLIDKVPGKYPELACFRYNPGDRRTGNEIIGKPEEAKYGVMFGQIDSAYRRAIEKGATRFGFHTMICSNELNYKYMVETVKMSLEMIALVGAELGIQFEFINIGGGLGTPYRPEQPKFDIFALGAEAEELFQKFREKHGYIPKLFTESGRFMTGPHGALVTSVINQKHTYREYRGVDACMSSLMRPGMYGAYHHISIVDSHGKLKIGNEEIVDVVGSLCENNDKFAVQRSLPKMVEGDFAMIHNTGAHGIAMCFQYNGRLRPPELLRRIDDSVHLIGRGETEDDLFARYEFTPKIWKP